jgi:sphinganine C4-monooxygenase
MCVYCEEDGRTGRQRCWRGGAEVGSRDKVGVGGTQRNSDPGTTRARRAMAQHPRDEKYGIHQLGFADSVAPANGTVPFYYPSQPSLLPWLSDRDLSLVAPVVVYWVSALFFHVLDVWGESWAWLRPYRIHESAEVKSRNLVSKSSVVTAVLFQQASQTLIGTFFLDDVVQTVDHWARMRKWSPILVQSTLLYMGNTPRAQQFLQTWGPSVIHFAYWWFIPALQLLWAL